MKKIFLTFPVITLLAACGTMADGQTHLVTVKTPGAENAKCLIENEDIKAVAYTNQTVRINKSHKDLVVQCDAPGNRQRAILVKREMNSWSILNVSNGFVPGVAYDYLSRGLFDYPDTFIVGFGGEPAKQEAMPDYMAEDLHYLEGQEVYRGPTVVRTRADNNQGSAFDLKKKAPNADDFSNFEPSSGESSLKIIERNDGNSMVSYPPSY